MRASACMHVCVYAYVGVFLLDGSNTKHSMINARPIIERKGVAYISGKCCTRMNINYR